MKYDIVLRPSYSALQCILNQGESIQAESGSMLAMDATATIEGNMQGGALQALSRAFLTNESFFVTTITANQNDAEVYLAPRTPGDIEVIDISNEEFLVQGGSFLASVGAVETNAKFSGWKGFLGGEGLFMIKVSGTGTLFISSFGGILKKELKPGEQFMVDNGHMVAFSSAIQYDIGKVGQGFGMVTTGEGLAYTFTGPGTLYMQTRNLKTFTETLNPFLPKRENIQGGGLLGNLIGG
ncbi:MAG: hypothetical protein JWM56_1245 [Candidatus Peribacteria bacterium]|nr:hypothetical protein [Candidatus Peribacteria bacterium]